MYCSSNNTTHCHTILLSISPDKAVGIDHISSRLLRIVAPEIAPSVARPINFSIENGVGKCAVN